MYTCRNDIEVSDGNDMIGGLPGQDVAIVIAQAKVTWMWPSKTDFKTGIELSDCGGTKLHKPSNKLWRVLLKAAVYLHVTRRGIGDRNKSNGGLPLAGRHHRKFGLLPTNQGFLRLGQGTVS